MTKPTNYIDWATDTENQQTEIGLQPNKIRPNIIYQTKGYEYHQAVPRNELNWQFNGIGLWARYLSPLNDSLTGYTVATLPTASTNLGRTIFVSDETGGAVTAFSDGTNWRRTTDRAIVS